ncbi:anaerobic ribonucleoside triphosphate reductase, partial [gut metagenome]
EIDAYAKMAQDKYGDKLIGLHIEVENDDEVILTYTLKNDVPFERIRRITGYLVGTLDKWNDAKRAEERDRVKHNIDQNIGD